MRRRAATRSSPARPAPAPRIKSDELINTNEPSDTSIIRSTIELAHNFKLTVTAEGVENEATLQTLRDLGCDQAQGYFISRPLPLDRFTEWQRKSAREKSSASPP